MTTALCDEIRRLAETLEETEVKRARNQLAGLAHAVKTPLTVIRNEAGQMEGESAEEVAERSERLPLRALSARVAESDDEPRGFAAACRDTGAGRCS